MPATLLAALAALNLALAAAASAAQPPDQALFAADPVEPSSSATASGTLGYLTLPALAAPARGRISLGLTGDFYRGNDFLLPDAVSQKGGGQGTISVGVASFLEAYGAISFHAANLSSSAGRRNLGSYGDSDLGLKLVLPRSGPVSAGLLAQLDLPAGVGGFSLRGAGAFAAALLGLSGRLGVPFTATLLAGYRIDNTYKLSKAPTTFSSFALALSSYDRVSLGVGLLLPFRYLAPAAELSLEAPVARQTPLPVTGHPIRARLGLGLAQIHTGVRGLTAMAGVQLSLEQTGRIDQHQQRLQGFSPDAPWSVLAGLTWNFDGPSLPKPVPELAWHQGRLAGAAPLAPAVHERARLVVTVVDARTQQLLPGAWVSLVEGSDVGATTGADGLASLEAEAGAVTVAVARDGYELLTAPILLGLGEEKQLVLSLQSIAADALLRGRLVGKDGTLLRAAITLSQIGSDQATVDAQTFEGSYQIPVQHGTYLLAVDTPGFRADLASIEVRPGETKTHDIVLRRLEGEATERLGPTAVEFSHPIQFAPGSEAFLSSALPVLAQLSEALKGELLPLFVEARSDPALEPGGAAGDELQGELLATARAHAIVSYLRDQGVKASLTPVGRGLARPGQPLLELRVAPARPAAPGSQLPLHPGGRTASLDVSRGHP